MNDYRIERLSYKNLACLVVLYKECFALNVSLSFIRAKYATHPFGASYIGYLAFLEDSQEPVAYYGVFPLICEIEGNLVLAAQSGDTMTHPKHQGKGLFVKLAQTTYELAKAEGIQFVFGFPNRNSYPGFVKKLSWKHCSDIVNYKIRVSWIPIDKIVKRFRIFQPLYDRFVESRFRKIQIADWFENSLRIQDSSYYTVLHDKRYFEYKRYFKHYKVKIRNSRLVLKVDGRLWVGEIENCGKQEFLELVGKLKKIARKLGCSSIQFSLSAGIPYEVYLREMLIPHSTSPVGVLPLSDQKHLENLKFQAFDFDTY